MRRRRRGPTPRDRPSDARSAREGPGFARLAADYMASLKEHGSNDPFGPRMLDFDGINTLVGTSEILETGRRYDMDNFDDDGD